MTTQCVKSTLQMSIPENFDDLSEDMKKLWIQTKMKQLTVKSGTKMKPLDTDSLLILDSMWKASEKLEGMKNISCSISGGSDSDVVLDLLARSYSGFKNINFVFFDTGIEYSATKEHLKDLEQKYGVRIDREKAIKSIPTCCSEFGVPFLSKYISDYISRLQRNNFQWEDLPYEVLKEKYPNCNAAIQWWCNKRKTSQFNIERRKFLKEFLIENPPNFPISDKCCKYAKKGVISRYNKKNGMECSISGVRRAEGGVRASAYKNCFSVSDIAQYRPIFWFTNSDKEEYCNAAEIRHSDCYEVYGLDRTGCAGCPFGKYFEEELEVISKYEPKLYKTVQNIFGKSYDYTRRYKEYVRAKERA